MKTGRLRLLWKFMAGYKLLYLAAIGAIAMATLASFVVPLALRLTIDSAIGGLPIDLPDFAVRIVNRVLSMEYLRTHLWIAAATIVGVTSAAGIFQFYHKKWSAVASERTAQSIREHLYDHLQHLSYDYHVKAETGDLIQRATSDVETVRRFIAVQVVEVGRSGILLATAYPLLFSLHVPLALLSVPIVVGIFGFSLVFFKRVQRAFKASDEAEGRLSNVLQENLTGIRVVRAFARQRHEEEKFGKRNTEFRDLTWKMMKMFAVYLTVSDLLVMGHMCATLLAGSWFAIQGQLSIGDMVVFLTVEGMLLDSHQ